MMKRSVSLLLVTILVFTAVSAGVPWVSAANASSVTIGVPQEITYTGDAACDVFDAAVSLQLAEGLGGVAGYEIILQWDASVLAFTGDIAIASPGMHAVNRADEATGAVKIVVANATDVITDGILFTASFYPLTDSADALLSVDVERLSTASGFVAANGGDASVALKPLPPVDVRVSENAVLTDGVSEVCDPWGIAGEHNVVLIQNSNCTKTDMDVEILYPLSGQMWVDSLSVWFYHDADAMIGYPAGDVTVWVSADGENYTELASFALEQANAALGLSGTVKNTFTFSPANAVAFKLAFTVGSSVDVLGPAPTDGKIFWEYAALTEIAHTRYCEHTYEETDSKDESCEADGEKTYTCKLCGDVYKETVSATGHTEGDWIVTQEPSCTEDGARALSCTVCGKVLQTEKFSAFGHKYGNGVVTLEPSCDAAGVKTFTCQSCGDSVTETLPALSHTEGEWETAVSSTCSENGSRVIKCTVCGEILQSETLPLLGHEYGDGSITHEPDCESDGVMSYTCKKCGDISTEPIPARGHTYDGGTVSVEPLCGTEGVMTFTCTVCGDFYTESIAALTHTESEWTVLKDSTCTENGTEIKTCTLCGTQLAERPTDMLDHDFDDGAVTVEPTCKEEGVKTYSCLICGTPKDETVPVKEHTAGAWVTVKEATTDSNGKKVRLCMICGDEVASAAIPNITLITEQAENITLIKNPDPLLAGLDATLLCELGTVYEVESITLHLYHCASSMIGYPEGNATVLVSADGITYEPVGEFALNGAALSLDAAGTVATEFKLEETVEAAYVKILLYAGDSTGVWGDSPDGGKIYWEYIGVVSAEIETVAQTVQGDVDGNGVFDAKDYVKLKRYILETISLDRDALSRADINRDGSIDPRDYLFLKRIYLGTLSFPE